MLAGDRLAYDTTSIWATKCHVNVVEKNFYEYLEYLQCFSSCYQNECKFQ